MKKILFILIVFHFQTHLKAQSVLNQITDSLDNRYAAALHYLNDSSQHVLEYIMDDNKSSSKRKSKTKIKWTDSVRFLAYDTICDKTIFIRSKENQKINLPIAHRYPGNSSVKDSSIIEYSIQTQNTCRNLKGLKKYLLSPISVYHVEFSAILNDCLIVELFRGSGEGCHEMKFGVGHFLLFVFDKNSSLIEKVYHGAGRIYN
jgi:hypothetical protein